MRQKPQVLCSAEPKLPTNILPLQIDNYKINWSPHSQYLSVAIGYNLNFNKHVTNITRKATSVRGMLYPVLNKTNPIPLKTQLNLLKLYVTPILTYAGLV